MEVGDASRGISSEIGPPLFPNATSGKAAAGAAGGLLKTLFGVAPPNSHSAMISRSSFKDLNFVGGEEDAQDAWRDKWEAHRRASLDECKRLGGSKPSGGGASGTSGTGGGVSRLGVPIPKSGDVYSVATGTREAGNFAPAPSTRTKHEHTSVASTYQHGHAVFFTFSSLTRFRCPIDTTPHSNVNTTYFKVLVRGCEE